MSEESHLTHDQQIFVLHYMLAKAQGSKSPTKEAAEKAGITYGYGRQLLTNSNVKEEIRRRYEQVAQPIFDKYVVTQEKIIHRYAQIAFHDPNDTIITDPDTGEISVLQINEMDEDVRMGLGAKVSDVKGALDSLSRINSMFQDNLNVKKFDEILKEVEAADGSDEPLVKEDDDDG